MVTIRAASEQDAEELPGIERSSGTIFHGWPGLEWVADDSVQAADLHRNLIARGVALVAEEQGQGLIGFLNAERTPDGLHIWQIAVHCDYQRRGIGRRLIKAAQQLAVARKAKSLTLTTFRTVPWNAPYYQRLGFRILPESELTPWLRQVLDVERQAGLPIEQRCAMLMQL